MDAPLDFTVNPEIVPWIYYNAGNEQYYQTLYSRYVAESVDAGYMPVTFSEWLVYIHLEGVSVIVDMVRG